VLSSIASGNWKQKKLVLEDRYFARALELLKTLTSTSPIKIGVLNLILNLIYKESDGNEPRARKYVIDMDISKVLAEMREKERDHEVKTLIDRIFKKLSD
jgi:hypothetical protein